MQRLRRYSILLILSIIMIIPLVVISTANPAIGESMPGFKSRQDISKGPDVSDDSTIIPSLQNSLPVREGSNIAQESSQGNADDLVKLRVSDQNSLTKGLVLYYRFNNQSAYGENSTFVYDYSLMQHIGRPSASTLFVPNRGVARSGTYVYDEEGDEIVVADSDSLSPATTNAFTVSFWVRFDELDFVGEGSQSSYKNFLGKGGNGEHEYLFRFYNSVNPQDRRNRISFYMFNPQGGLGTGSYVQEPVEKGEWVYITGVFNGTHTQMWKNGVFKDTDPLLGYNITTQNRNSPLRIGTYNGASYLKCSIDELRIYNRALSQSEISALYRLKR